MRKLSGHLDDVDLVVAGETQMLDQLFGIDHFAATNDASEVGVEGRIAQSHAGCREWREDDVRRAGGNLPKGYGAFFLNFRVRRLALEREHIVSGQADDGLGRNRSGELGKRADDGEQLLNSTVVGDNDDQRVCGGTL
jgi:hypothetical protein